MFGGPMSKEGRVWGWKVTAQRGPMLGAGCNSSGFLFSKSCFWVGDEGVVLVWWGQCIMGNGPMEHWQNDWLSMDRPYWKLRWHAIIKCIFAVFPFENLIISSMFQFDIFQYPNAWIVLNMAVFASFAFLVLFSLIESDYISRSAQIIVGIINYADHFK